MKSNFLGPFEGFDTVLQAEFQKYGKVVNFSKNSYPFSPDDALKWFYIIINGKVKVYDINFETNREQTLYMLIRGDMFDVVSLLDNSYHELAIDVLESGQALRFPIVKVREWMKQNSNFEQLIYKYVATQIRSVESLATDISLLDTRDRLLKLLLKNIEIAQTRGVNILDNLSHSEIAALIGTVRHIIDRHLKQLKEDEILEDKKRTIILKDAKKVLEMLDSAGI